jgi:AraC family transcriptional regulator
MPLAARDQERFQRVLDYIDAHLDEDLSVDVLSSVAAFSKFHFHRQFAAAVGVGTHRYVQLARFKRAVFRLAFRDGDPITEIALSSGYEGLEAFSRAFKKLVGQTPSGFRRQPQWASWHAAYRPLREMRGQQLKKSFNQDQVGIVEVEEMPVAVLEHRGDPALIEESLSRFIAWRRRRGVTPKISATFNILYDDPSTTPPEDFRLDLCAAFAGEVLPNEEGIVAKTIPAGRCAVLRLIGSDNGIGDAGAFLYGGWLPQSGEMLRDFPLYCQRVAFFPDVPEHQTVTDLFLPLK